MQFAGAVLLGLQMINEKRDWMIWSLCYQFGHQLLQEQRETSDKRFRGKKHVAMENRQDELEKQSSISADIYCYEEVPEGLVFGEYLLIYCNPCQGLLNQKVKANNIPLCTN